MHSRFLGRLAALAFLAGALSSCGTTPTSPSGSGTSAEQLAITTTLLADPTLVADDLFDASAQAPAFGLRPAGPSTATQPRWFWRSITGQTRRFEFAFSDSDSTGRPRQADVVVHRRLTGVFNVLNAMPGDSTRLDSTHVVRKPLDDAWERRLRLRRVTRPGTDSTAWKVVGASGAQVTSSGAITRILSIRVQSGDRDTTITDPLALWSLPQTRQFAPGDSVVMTATTSASDDVVLAYWHDHRERFRNNHDGTHSFTLRIRADESGKRFFAVNALSRGTLFDDALPYDSIAWVFHCYVGERPPGNYF